MKRGGGGDGGGGGRGQLVRLSLFFISGGLGLWFPGVSSVLFPIQPSLPSGPRSRGKWIIDGTKQWSNNKLRHRTVLEKSQRQSHRSTMPNFVMAVVIQRVNIPMGNGFDLVSGAPPHYHQRVHRAATLEIRKRCSQFRINHNAMEERWVDEGTSSASASASASASGSAGRFKYCVASFSVGDYHRHIILSP
ncbi:hypothetical protein M0804_005699 [Polistes exclamans]|nr:hypothetical protein M0804_005699 [Polistes exclamans]